MPIEKERIQEHEMREEVFYQILTLFIEIESKCHKYLPVVCLQKNPYCDFLCVSQYNNNIYASGYCNAWIYSLQTQMLDIIMRQ